MYRTLLTTVLLHKVLVSFPETYEIRELSTENAHYNCNRKPKPILGRVKLPGLEEIHGKPSFLDFHPHQFFT